MLYKINQWQQIIDNTNIIRPVFTFTPDSKFLQYILNNSNLLLIDITGAIVENPPSPYLQTPYDGRHYATVISSAEFPTLGPNYYNATKEYVMVLHTTFTVYPTQNGEFSISFDVRHDESDKMESESYMMGSTGDGGGGEIIPSKKSVSNINNIKKILFWIMIVLFLIAIILFLYII